MATDDVQKAFYVWVAEAGEPRTIGEVNVLVWRTPGAAAECFVQDNYEALGRPETIEVCVRPCDGGPVSRWRVEIELQPWTTAHEMKG